MQFPPINVRFWDVGQVQIVILAIILFGHYSVFGVIQLVSCTQMISVPIVLDIVPEGQLHTVGEFSTILFMQDKQLVAEVQLKHPCIWVEQTTQDMELFAFVI